ncbi:MAG: hypothetical protein R3D66_03790 [Alphaproteobacteria bacterium]
MSFYLHGATGSASSNRFWSEEREAFVELFLPHKMLGILHISGWDEMRLNRALTTDFKILESGEMTKKSYRYFRILPTNSP